MILDYSEYNTESAEDGVVNFIINRTNLPLFTHKPHCPFCDRAIDNEVHSKTSVTYPVWLNGEFRQSETVIQCPICGWWEYQYKTSSDAILDGIRASSITFKSAILKQFNNSSIEVPVNELRKYLLKKPDVIYGIDAHKMEELVRSVFKDFYPNCQVISMGKTRDVGKDAILIDNQGKHFFVSVKRRSDPNKTEGVDTIRDLLGAMIAHDGITGCIYVSTADHFSSDALKHLEKVKASSSNIVDTFELYDFKRFIEAIHKSASKLPDSWSQLLKLK